MEVDEFRFEDGGGWVDKGMRMGLGKQRAG